ncbi:MAG TPA: hypothetical protein VNQ80_15345 [Parapedobacter sp.]|uniref:HNH endonuclease n=1 Tax=Parapedobacter sp. TaxID=1958893 RepID=UPI002C328962|nr:hypothetical protein [Parapedobacter sp.]HWK58717.1 hypothetical protein [Parapedobacter sp.]
MPCDYSEYPANWNEIRQRILERANHCCEFCGVANYTVKANGTKVVLTIAHLDHDKSNADVLDDRLRALCQACHLKYDLPRHIENRKYGRNWRRDQLKLNF